MKTILVCFIDNMGNLYNGIVEVLIERLRLKGVKVNEGNSNVRY